MWGDGERNWNKINLMFDSIKILKNAKEYEYSTY